MTNYNSNTFSQQHFPFDANGLGSLKGFYSSEENTFAKMFGAKSFLWILLPIIGWFILFVLFIQFLYRTYPSRYFWIFEHGFVWKKNERIDIIRYSDIDSLYYEKTANYKNGTYQYTSHVFQTFKNKTSLFKNVAWDNNEQNIEDKKSYLVRAFQAAEMEIQQSLIERAQEEYKRRNYVSLIDEEVLVGSDFIRDKTGFDYTRDNINKVYYSEGEVIVECKDYKNKMIGHEGHKLVLSMDTNRILKLFFLEELLGWRF